jgi:hypothetical protein
MIPSCKVTSMLLALAISTGCAMQPTAITPEQRVTPVIQAPANDPTFDAVCNPVGLREDQARYAENCKETAIDGNFAFECPMPDGSRWLYRAGRVMTHETQAANGTWTTTCWVEDGLVLDRVTQ